MLRAVNAFIETMMSILTILVERCSLVMLNWIEFDLVFLGSLLF